jgi:hypothetical protein
MATLYYNAAVDTYWDTLGNWWTDAAHTTQASAIPASGDSVILSASCFGPSDGSNLPPIANLTFSGEVLQLEITVTGMATFNSGRFHYGNITGNVTFNASARMDGWPSGTSSATVTGNATFNDSSIYQGNSSSSVSGNATFTGSAQMQNGTITGNATFNGSSSIIGGTLNGNATFNDTSLLDGINYPYTSGTVVLNDYATANGSWYAADPTTFNDHANLSNQYVTTEPCEFNDHATCNGFGMRSNATFNDFSVCAGVVDGGYPMFTFNDSATGGLDVQSGGWWAPPEPDVTYNDRSYGSGKAKSLTINGAAVMQSAYLNGYNPVLDYSFTRPQYGINGSSILGVI